MGKIKSWDGISSFDDDLDRMREPDPRKYFKKRTHLRMKAGAFSSLFDMEEMLVTLTTEKETFIDPLLNISVGGLAVQLPTSLSVNHPCTIRIVFGGKYIFSKAKVRQVRKIGEQYVAGIMFIDLTKKSADYIGGSIYIKALLSSWAIEVEPEDVFFSRDGRRPDFFENSNDRLSNAFRITTGAFNNLAAERTVCREYR